MQAEVFQDLCMSIWDKDGSGNFPHHAREIAAQMCNPQKIEDLPTAGAFAVVFPDMSVAICGARGFSIVATFSVHDHADPESYERKEDKPSWDGFLSFLSPTTSMAIQALIMEELDNDEDVTAFAPYKKGLESCE